MVDRSSLLKISSELFAIQTRVEAFCRWARTSKRIMKMLKTSICALVFILRQVILKIKSEIKVKNEHMQEIYRRIDKEIK